MIERTDSVPPYEAFGNKCPHFELARFDCNCPDCIREEIRANAEMCDCDVCKEASERAKPD